MGRRANEALKSTARAYWFSMPTQKRSVGKVIARLAASNMQASRSNVARWAIAWRSEAKAPIDDMIQTVADVLRMTEPIDPEPPLKPTLPKPTPEPAPLPPKQPMPEVRIPTELSEILGARVAALLASRGLTDVEDVIARFARSISVKAEEITDAVLANPEVGKTVLSAIGTLSNAVHIVAQARSITAETYRASSLASQHARALSFTA
jgi:hypothetical protein